MPSTPNQIRRLPKACGSLVACAALGMLVVQFPGKNTAGAAVVVTTGSAGTTDSNGNGTPGGSATATASSTDWSNSATATGGLEATAPIVIRRHSTVVSAGWADLLLPSQPLRPGPSRQARLRSPSAATAAGAAAASQEATPRQPQTRRTLPPTWSPSTPRRKAVKAAAATTMDFRASGDRRLSVPPFTEFRAETAMFM